MLSSISEGKNLNIDQASIYISSTVLGDKILLVQRFVFKDSIETIYTKISDILDLTGADFQNITLALDYLIKNKPIIRKIELVTNSNYIHHMLLRDVITDCRGNSFMKKGSDIEYKDILIRLYNLIDMFDEVQPFYVSITNGYSTASKYNNDLTRHTINMAKEVL